MTVEVVQDTSGKVLTWDGRYKVDLSTGVLFTGATDTLWDSNEVGQNMGRAATPAASIGGSDVSGDGWNVKDPNTSGFGATPITNIYNMTGGSGSGLVMSLTFAPLRNSSNTKAGNTIIILNKVINYGSGYQVDDVISCDEWDNNFTDSADRIFKITAVTELPTGSLEADGNNSDITITSGQAVLLAWTGDAKISNHPPVGVLRGWDGRYKVDIDDGTGGAGTGYWDTNYCLYPMGRNATPGANLNGSDTATNGWSLREGSINDDGFGANPVEGNYRLQYKVSDPPENKTGSNMRMNISFFPLRNEDGDKARNTKIVISNVKNSGTGYKVGDILSVDKWTNDFYGSAERIIKVTEVTTDPNDETSYVLTVQGGNDINTDAGNNDNYLLDPGPSTTTTYSYNVEGPGGKIKVKRKVIVQAAPGEPSASIGSAQSSVVSGTCTFLTWSSTNGVSYTLEDSDGNTIVQNPGASNTEGFQVCPTQDTTYVYTVTGGTGTTPATDQVTVTVTQPPPAAPTASISASPLTFVVGNPNGSTLTWSSTNGSTYTLKDGANNVILANPGASSPAGGFKVTPAQTTKYTYTVTSGSGTSVSDDVTVTVSVPDLPTVSLEADPLVVIAGGDQEDRCSVLTWESSGGDTFSLTDVSNPGASGSATVCPTTTKTYTFTATNAGGSNEDGVEITVYTKPIVTIEALPDASIIAGESVNIKWSTSGDADRFVWTQGDISNTFVSSESDVEPTVTTTYSGYATGLGGDSDIASVTVVVSQIPTLTVTYPTSIAYNTQANIEYTSNYVNSSLTLTPTYYYLSDDVVTGDAVNLTISNSAEPGVGTTEVTDTYTTTIPYTDKGPISVAFYISGSGTGGVVSSTDTVPIVIDITPENLNILDTEDLLADQAPVVTPGTDVLTEQYYIDDIDIDVEVKANYPIQVQLNNSGTWVNVREL